MRKNIDELASPGVQHIVLHGTRHNWERKTTHGAWRLMAPSSASRLRTLSTVPQRYMTVLNNALSRARFRSSLPLNPIWRLWAVLGESRTGLYQQFSSGYHGVLRDILNR